jgi:hypothetical protein
MDVSLFDEFYGDGVFKIRPFIGSDGGQDAVNDIDDEQRAMEQSHNAQRKDPIAKGKIIAVKMKVQCIVTFKVKEPKMANIKELWQKPNKERNGDHTYDNGIEQQADLKVQGLFAIVIHKGIFLFIGRPKDQGQYEVAKGDKELGKRTRMDEGREVTLMFVYSFCHGS